MLCLDDFNNSVRIFFQNFQKYNSEFFSHIIFFYNSVVSWCIRINSKEMILFNSPQLERKEVPFRNAVWFKYLTQSINPWKPLNNLHSLPSFLLGILKYYLSQPGSHLTDARAGGGEKKTRIYTVGNLGILYYYLKRNHIFGKPTKSYISKITFLKTNN